LTAILFTENEAQEGQQKESVRWRHLTIMGGGMKMAKTVRARFFKRVIKPPADVHSLSVTVPWLAVNTLLPKGYRIRIFSRVTLPPLIVSVPRIVVQPGYER
jgi:hypothetical protein